MSFHEDLESILKCPRCKRLYEDARIIVPCSQTLCLKCIEELTNGDRFECFFCHVNHVHPHGGFNANATIESLLKLRLKNVSPQVDRLRENLIQIESLNYEYKDKAKGLKSSLNEHCASIRNSIDLISDEKIQQINQIRDTYLKKVHNYQQSCLKNVNDNEMLIETKQSELKEYTNKYKTYLREFDTDDQAIKQYILESRLKIDEIKCEIKNLDLVKFDGNQTVFESNQNQIPREFLGHFKTTKLEKLDFVNEIKIPIVSSSFDKTLKVWNLQNGQCTRTLIGHTSYVGSVVCVDESRLVSGCDDKTLKVWDLNDGNCIRTLTGHSDHVYCLVVIDSNKIVSGSFDKTIKIWNLQNGECVRTLQGHIDRVVCLCRIDRKTIVSGSLDKMLKVWNLDEGECRRTLEGHTSGIHGVSKLDNTRIVSGSYDKTLKIWHVETGACLTTLEGHTNAIYCVLAIGGSTIISGSSDREIKIWKLNQGIDEAVVCVRTLQDAHSDAIRCFLSIGKNIFISGSHDNKIKMWNLENGTCVRTLEGHSSYVCNVSTIV